MTRRHDERPERHQGPEGVDRPFEDRLIEAGREGGRDPEEVAAEAPPPGLLGDLLGQVPEGVRVSPELRRAVTGETEGPPEAGDDGRGSVVDLGARRRGRRLPVGWLAAASVVLALGAGLVALRVLEEVPAPGPTQEAAQAEGSFEAEGPRAAPHAPQPPDAGAPDLGAPDLGAPDLGATESGATESGAPQAAAPETRGREEGPTLREQGVREDEVADRALAIPEAVPEAEAEIEIAPEAARPPANRAPRTRRVPPLEDLRSEGPPPEAQEPPPAAPLPEPIAGRPAPPPPPPAAAEPAPAPRPQAEARSAPERREQAFSAQGRLEEQEDAREGDARTAGDQAAGDRAAGDQAAGDLAAGDRAGGEEKRLSEELGRDLEEAYGERRQQRAAPREEAARDLAFPGAAAQVEARSHWEEIRDQLAAGRLPAADEVRSAELLRALGVGLPGGSAEAVPGERGAPDWSRRARRFVRLLEAAAAGREELEGRPLGAAVSALASEVEAAVRERGAGRREGAGKGSGVGPEELAAALRDLEVVLATEGRP